ncbi:response regulator [Paracoccus sp. p4-l81]|uniref:response regulator n=1 Tax=unclassified Paracoccus (in: a-proteobacteria) TaxID=2688777 RepID=UPI0035BAF2C2
MQTDTPAANQLILVVEDEREIAEILTAYLEQAGFRTVTASDGDTALTHAARLRPDLILLDLRLPRRDGFSVLSTLRVDNTTPVIVISALSDDLDKLSALRIGADDYVTKPFNPREVVARVQAVLRRSSGVVQSVKRIGNLTLDPDGHRVEVAGQELLLTPSEYSLLAGLMRYPGRAYSRADLLDACLESSEALERTVDSHMSNLRRKLAQAGSEARLVTVRGLGYRLETG